MRKNFHIHNIQNAQSKFFFIIMLHNIHYEAWLWFNSVFDVLPLYFTRNNYGLRTLYEIRHK